MTENPSKAPALDERVLREQVDSLLRTGINASYGAFIVGLVFWVIAYRQLGNNGALVWGTILFATQLVRYIGNRSYLALSQAQRDPKKWGSWYSNALLANGVAWALAPWLFFPKGNFPVQSLMMLILLGMTSAGIASIAPHRRALFSFTVPILPSLALALLWHGETHSAFLALCCLIYLAVSLKFGLQQNKLLTEALVTRYEKEDLAKQLTEQVAKTERASAEKTRFFAAASHDLRQPLHAISLMGSALQHSLADKPQAAHINRMMRSVDALSESLGAMLDVSRLDAGVVTPNPQPVMLSQLLLALRRTFFDTATEKGLQWRTRFPTDVAVIADIALLTRLLSNLVDNALKYTPRGGVLIAARVRGESVRIDIIDTGIGMSAEHHERVFEEFFQIDNLGRDRAKGLGLGLSIVKRLSTLLNVPVRLRSRAGLGTCFTVTLPRSTINPNRHPTHGGRALDTTQIPNESAKDMPSALTATKPGRVLLIDDETDIRESIVVLLGQHGVHIDAVEDELEAMQIIKHVRTCGETIDVVLCDFRLAHGINGLALLLRLRELLPAPCTHILITGETSHERLAAVRESGLPVLYKPVKANHLLRVLSIT